MAWHGRKQQNRTPPEAPATCVWLEESRNEPGYAVGEAGGEGRSTHLGALRAGDPKMAKVEISLGKWRSHAIPGNAIIAGPRSAHSWWSPRHL